MKVKWSVAAAVVLALLLHAPAARASGPFTAYIDRIQTTDVGSAYNTVWLQFDVTTSPCGSTNAHNRFVITTKVQHATVLAALLAGKQIRVQGSGACNAVDIETMSTVYIFGAN